MNSNVAHRHIQGAIVQDVSLWYLRYAVKTFPWLSPWFREAAQAVIDGEPLPHGNDP